MTTLSPSATASDATGRVPEGRPASAGPPVSAVPSVSVVILTFNEQANIEACLRSCAWCDDVHVVDSGSTDDTCRLAEALGAKVHHHPFESFGRQRNWAIDQIAHANEWVFHLDADERFTPELVAEMRDVLAASPAEAGYFVPHKLMFMGRWLRYAEGGYPIYQMRLFHKTRMRFCDYGHGQREQTDGAIGMLRQPYLHFGFSKGLEEWVDKHNRYSTLEAHEAFAERSKPRRAQYSAFGNSVERRRFFKAYVFPRVPGSWLGRFFWMYVCRLGFLDGTAGLHYCLLVGTYDLLTSLKLAELRRQARRQSEERHLQPLTAAVVSQVPADARRRPAAVHWKSAGSPTPLPDSPAIETISAGAGVDQPSSVAKQKSPWTMRQKIGRVLWMAVQATLFRWSFHNWYGWRRMLLRAFGARIGKNVRVRPTVRTEIPWHLDIEDSATVGDYAILYSLGSIRIGRNSTVSQYAHLCAGTHDYTRPHFPLVCPPITLGHDVWVAADAFVGPGVTVGNRAIVGARATVVRDVPPDKVVGGNPARLLKDREPTLLNDSTPDTGT